MVFKMDVKPNLTGAENKATLSASRRSSPAAPAAPAPSAAPGISAPKADAKAVRRNLMKKGS